MNHTINAETIATALGGEKSGKGWICKCPSHEDKTSSLSISDGNNGSPLIHCFAGCNFKDISSKLRSMGLWPDATPEQKKQATKKNNQSKIDHALLVKAIAGHTLEKGEELSRNDLEDVRTADKVLIKAGEQSPLLYRCMDDIKSKPVDWLWPGRIAKGKVSMIVGNPGLGKSQVTLSMAAIVSTGSVWPASNEKCDQGNVIILSAEDDAEDTIRPRLEAASADLKKINYLEAYRYWTEDDEEIVRTINIKTDILAIEKMLVEIGNASLIIIDPITAYLGNTDSHKNAEVRSLLSPLSAMAAKHNLAIVCVSHLNKSGRSEALMRITGSLAFVAAARAAYLVTKDSDSDRLLFLPVKNNIGNDKEGLAFEIESYTLTDNIETSRVAWHSDIVRISADEALLNSGEPKNKGALEEVKDFLTNLLDYNPLPANEVFKQANDAGFSNATIRRAKVSLKIKSDKKGFDGQWEWCLPNNYGQGAQDDTLQKNEHLEHLRVKKANIPQHAQHAQDSQRDNNEHLQNVRCPQCRNYSQDNECHVGIKNRAPFTPAPCEQFKPGL